MHILWVLLTVPAVVTTVQGQRPLACDSVGDGSPVCSCRSGRVSCEDADLTDVPTDIPPDTGTLELTGNKITSLPELVFDDLPQVSTLDLSDNEIASIEVGAFDGLGGSLSKLDLNNNELIPERITKSSFKTMHILWVLLTVPAVVTTVQGQRPLACDSVGDGSPVCSCRSGRVSCEDADLTDVPTDIPPDTGTLELSGNKITSLPALVFDGLPEKPYKEVGQHLACAAVPCRINRSER
ncbi:decorin-like [Branchiostoma floridae]|uniref:Decorin-like n=1 Tax=Branchiostoma floridae TaxID=7739 RepID=A0A9J7LWV2_BRAFL|nr:decorin-like [Branchiostoma floridae]